MKPERQFHCGLVVGKFSPLHLGHEHLLCTALESCEKVVVLSYSKPEFPGCEAVRRKAWFAGLFPEIRHIAVTDDTVRQWKQRTGRNDFDSMPANDASEITHRRFCGFICQHILAAPVDAVFTSETYGDELARELTRYFREYEPSAPVVRHALVDLKRWLHPVSGSRVRANIHAMRQWLSPQVYASFVDRVCLLGGESSGKSTLARCLAQACGTLHVEEFGRQWWETKQGRLEFDDMLFIAQTQTQREEEAAHRAVRYLFCDTSPLTTFFYSHHLFGKVHPALASLAARPYTETLLCAPDIAFEQDGTRQDSAFRLRQHEWYLSELKRRDIKYHLVTGPLKERLAQAQALLASSFSSTACDSCRAERLPTTSCNTTRT